MAASIDNPRSEHCGVLGACPPLMLLDALERGREEEEDGLV